MRARGTLVLILLLSGAACDRMPADPLDSPGIAALAGITGQGAAPQTLAGLMYSAIRDVHAQQGTDAALQLVQNLARLQQRLDGAPVEERGVVLQQLREEQLSIVLRVHGDEIVARTIGHVREQVDHLTRKRTALAASGIAAPDISAGIDSVRALLVRAGAEAGARALDAATRAAALADVVRLDLAGAARLPSLDDLYDDATVRLGIATPHPLVASFQALRTAADAALRSQDGERAQAAAVAARDAQIRVILAGLGPDAVADVVGRGRDRGQQLQPALSEAGAARDVSRLERMNLSALDMLERAESRLRRGDSAGALDLAGHAVDLLNALEATLHAR